MTNLTQFKCKNAPFINYINNQVINIIKDNDLENKDNIIYISAPMTGIDNYSERFKQMYTWIKFIYHERDVFILNPSVYLDSVPEELNATYIDKMFYCFKLLNLCNILIIDDSNNNWIKSRGCLSELIYAQSNGIDTYGYDYIINATRFRKLIDGTFENYKKEEKDYMEYEIIWG